MRRHFIIGLTKWLTPEDNPPLGLNTLQLEDIRESANYTCEAASVLGVIETTAEVKVQCKCPPIIRRLKKTLKSINGYPQHIVMAVFKIVFSG